MQVRFLSWKDPLEEEMASHSSILAWRIPGTEEPGGQQSMRSQSQTQLKRLSTHTCRPAGKTLPPGAKGALLPTCTGAWTPAGSRREGSSLKFSACFKTTQKGLPAHPHLPKLLRYPSSGGHSS